MSYVLRLETLEGRNMGYLQAVDVETALITCNFQIEFAMIFATAAEALATWQMTDPISPIRADGRPNRPLTAFSAEVTPYDPPLSS